MILLVPYKPEVPHYLSPRIWPGLVLVIFLGIAFLHSAPTLESDRTYVDGMGDLIYSGDNGLPMLKPEGHRYLELRPLLKIAPAKGDWSWGRLAAANFLHGSSTHLLLNLVGTFAGARICSTFLPFPAILFIFMAGGSLGLLLSMLLSSEISTFIPHVGASAGIFAMMGTYYVYNFRFRTKYFFWFPSRAGVINLRTNWFFFVDVILLELVLSTAQFFPNRLGNVDHIAHVVGFLSGVTIALVFRVLANWPHYLQTRGEYVYWRRVLRPRGFKPKVANYSSWLEILEVNPYNDIAKTSLCHVVVAMAKDLADDEVQKAFRFISPTYIRLHPEEVARVIRTLLARGKKLPEWWYKSTPYDSIIRLARELSQPVEEQYLLYDLIEAYRTAHPEGGSVDRKLELLMSKIRGFIPGARTGAPRQGGNPDSALSGTSPRDTAPNSTGDKATKAS